MAQVESKARATSEVEERKKVLERIKDEGVEFLLLWFTDLEGHLKSFAVTPAEIEEAARDGARIRHVATLGFSGPDGSGELEARVEPVALRPDDPLADVEGVTNAIVCRAEPVGEVTVVGPGAGLALAGQGVLSDLIAVVRR